MSKSQPPLQSLALEEMAMKAEGIRVNGLAVGQDAEVVAESFFQNTEVAHDPHEFKARIGGRMQSALEDR